MISRIDDIGKIWVRNEKQRKINNSFKRKGVKEIGSYKRDLAKLSRFVDETQMQIRKNVQQAKIDSDRQKVTYDILDENSNTDG